MEILELPFNSFVGIIRGPENEGSLSLPDDRRYTNHLGTVHASALLALAEAASGDFLIHEFAEAEFEVLPVVRTLEAKFRKPARGRVFSVARVSDNSREAFFTRLRSRGKAVLQIEVDICDANEVVVMSATVEWFVAKQTGGSASV